VLTPVPFYFLRHGETDWNRRRIIQGQTDTPLSEIGLAQAEAVTGAVERLDFATICSSPLKRARTTAEIVNRHLGKPVVYLPAMMECALGQIEGQPSNGDWREPWVSGGPMPGGETFEAYTTRVLGAFNQALVQPGPVLVVGHGGNFWALEHHGLIPNGTRVANCALFRLEPPRAKPAMWTVVQLAGHETDALAIGEAPAL
jgi:broad specificity phosphatase PhoE